MIKYVAILRGINVAGSKPIKMDDLKKMFEDLKYKNVRTYIQSGNIFFESDITDQGKLENQISERILKIFKFEVPVITRNIKELYRILNINPFLKERNIDISKLHVTFLSGIPQPEKINNIQGKNYEADRFIIIDKEIYLYCAGGYGITKLNNNFFENKLSLKATTRNWKTVLKLIEILEK
jgi:uncharacterized protein (DUF1697 family)